jgi:hypothetical protein
MSKEWLDFLLVVAVVLVGLIGMGCVLVCISGHEDEDAY